MKRKTLLPMKIKMLAVILFLHVSSSTFAQFGSFASAIHLSKDGGISKDFYNTNKLVGDVNAIGPVDFTADLGTFNQNGGKLILSGGEVKTFRGNNDNVCGAKLYYRVYPNGNPSGSFSPIDLPFFANCNSGVFTDGKGPCAATDQKWQTVASNIDLSISGNPGVYTLEVYFEVYGKVNSSTECTDTTYDSNNGNNFKANFTIAAPLPVRLVDFKALYKQGKPFLIWSTLSEENFSRFIVQRSNEGTLFEDVATLMAKGNSNSKINYQFADHTAKASIHFYRLKQVDIDGKFVYSNIVKTNGSKEVSLMLTPNPASIQVVIQGCKPGDHINITDITGRVLYNQIANGNTMAIPVHTLKPGRYFANVLSNKRTTSLSFIKE